MVFIFFQAGDPLRKRGVVHYTTMGRLRKMSCGGCKVAGDSAVPRIIDDGRVNRPVRIRTIFEPSPFAQIKLQHCGLQTPVASPLR